jgi:hypothetical protein
VTEPDREMRMVTSVRVEPAGAHDRVSVWNDGAFAGELVVEAGDGGPLAERLVSNGHSVRIERDGAAIYWPGYGPAPLHEGSI